MSFSHYEGLFSFFYRSKSLLCCGFVVVVHSIGWLVGCFFVHRHNKKSNGISVVN